MSKNNPLLSFFRKPKLKLLLPSRGKWYSANALDSDVVDGSVNVYAMTAPDEARFKTNELLLATSSTFDLIKSCIPSIKNPTAMPGIDLDAALLAIRCASYGDLVEVDVKVPNTELTRKIHFNLRKYLENTPDISKLWDSELNLYNEDNEKLSIIIKPVSAEAVFELSKHLIDQQEKFNEFAKISDNSEKISLLDKQLKEFSSLTVQTLAESIAEINAPDGTVISRIGDIKHFLTNIDVQYIKEIQKHTENQKDLIVINGPEIESTPEEISQGAPEKWTAKIDADSINYLNE